MTVAGMPLSWWRRNMSLSGDDLITFALGLLTALAAMVGKWLWRRESIEERLQRWQSETVRRVTEENQALRLEVAQLRLDHARVSAIEFGLKLAVTELDRIAPDNLIVLQLHDVMAVAFPVQLETPDDIDALADKVK